ncbi:MAG TPA: serine/threonine-protein kinase [Labilithrix sp.]|nr:serine/threonine-protein kinase [Labilithrix sp.]
MILEENTVVADRFRLIRMIGRGGMGSVWHAFDTRLDIACALKFIEGELANVAEAHARFEREAKAAAALRSPHVVEIKDHGVWQGTPYIAMELLDGEDLGKALAKAQGKLPPAEVNMVIQQVCRALTKAHAAGIVHRDLKPDNIFLVNDDDRKLVKILDFGVAKQTLQGIDGSNTKTGAMLGTPYYMSPEQAQGIKSVDARSDLWSLAVIVYQCITGRLPFESEALGDLLVKIIVQPVPVPSHVAQVPPGFDRWWAKAAERNPDARFSTAKEFAVELELALGQPGLGGTAIMDGSVSARMPAPSAPSFSGGQTAALLLTPNPANPTPHGMALGPHTPANLMSPELSGSGNVATFSGVEPPVTIPKKSPPIAVIAGIAAVLLVGVAGAGLAVARRGPSPSEGPSSPPSAAAVMPPPTAPATVMASATASASASVATETPAAPPPSASEDPAPAVASATASTAASAAKPKATNGGAAVLGGAGGGFGATAAPQPSASTKKKWEAGF